MAIGQVINGRHVGGRRRPVETPVSHPNLFVSLRDVAPLPIVNGDVDWYSQVAGLDDSLGNGTDPVTVDGKVVGPLGDCTACAATHMEESFSVINGAPVVFQAPDAVHFYEGSTGYVLGDESTDQGGDEVTVLTYWRDHGLSGRRIAGWLDVDVSNVNQIRSLVGLFGPCLYFGVELPDSYLQVNAGGTWGVDTPNPQNGHAFPGIGCTSVGIPVDSWGLVKPSPIVFTYDAIASLCADAAGGQLFAVLSPEMIVRGIAKTPNGYDWASFLSLFDAHGGNAPANAPSLADRIRQGLTSLAIDAARILGR